MVMNDTVVNILAK